MHPTTSAVCNLEPLTAPPGQSWGVALPKRLITWLALLVAPALALATPYTPLTWQSRIDNHANQVFTGQRKNTTWVRDRNRNFIDDEIEARFKPGDTVNVTVALNRVITPGELESVFARFGAIRHVGQLVTFILLDRVKVADLGALAARPEVAMVEWRAPDVPEMDIASRAIQARQSTVYAGLSAQDQGLTGAGINIAIVDGGVDDGAASAFTGLRNLTFVAGYDATDATDTGTGTRNPAQLAGFNHGSVMAAIALGRAAPGHACRTTATATSGADCAGIAPGAGLVDVKMCTRNSAGDLLCDPEKALDWIGTRAQTFQIRVVNYSFSRCGDDDGTSALAQLANYLGARGLVFVASTGNAPSNASCVTPQSPQVPIGGRLTQAPASGSDVIGVTGSNDSSSIARSDDAVFTNHFVGPRKDWNLIQPDISALKPDIAAPQNMTLFQSGTTQLTGIQGTSPAAAVVSGAAALLLQKFPGMGADSVKQAVLGAADNSRNSAYSTSTGSWDSALGAGLLNVGGAINTAVAQASNPRFVNCKTPSAGGPGQLCELRNTQPVWFNDTDIQSTSTPQVGVQTTIRAHVINQGANTATFVVKFGVYIFGTGNNQFHHIGTKQVTLAPNTDQWVTMDWTPAATNHQCVQVAIASGLDNDYTDNLTQRNFQVLPSQYTLRVENPLFVPARLDVEARSQRAGWTCRVSDRSFTLDPFTDRAREVTINFDAPARSRVGQQADCDVAVYATAMDGRERRLVGGVTVRTFVPRVCRAYGELVDQDGRPVAGASVRVGRVKAGTPESGKANIGSSVSVSTDRDGVYNLAVASGARHRFTVQKRGVGNGTLVLRPGCGLAVDRLVLGQDGLRAKALRYTDASE